jgi:hypothetical protein
MLRINAANELAVAPDLAPGNSSSQPVSVTESKMRGAAAQTASYLGSMAQPAVVLGASYFLYELIAEGLGVLGEKYGGETGKFAGKQTGVVLSAAVRPLLEHGATFLCAKGRVLLGPNFAKNPKVDPEAMEKYKLAAFLLSAPIVAIGKGAANSAIPFSSGALGVVQKAGVGGLASAAQAGLAQLCSNFYARAPGIGETVKIPKLSVKTIVTRGLAYLAAAMVKIVTNVGVSGIKIVPERLTLANDVLDTQAQAGVRYVVEKKLLKDETRPTLGEVDGDGTGAGTSELHSVTSNVTPSLTSNTTSGTNSSTAPKPVARSSREKTAEPALVSYKKRDDNAAIVEIEPQILQAVTATTRM